MKTECDECCNSDCPPCRFANKWNIVEATATMLRFKAMEEKQ